ncbi:MAG: tRNA 2-thiouridine(34) synthase MnmA [Burkholderiaceae bacterium]|nr:tRNA 2-thiouridine(34) synthase MnmA [Burkholderiaceae bacterium]
MKAKPKVVVGLSGGVDSSVSAWLLKQQGYEVIGIFMKNWEDDDDSGYCSSNIDFVDAASVADVIGIEIEHVNFAAEYKDRVFAEFLREYQAGRTPNPDILCNAEIKFKAFLDHACALGADKIATGHYARVRCVGTGAGADGALLPVATARLGDGRFELLKGLDASKDQSYFLHRLTQAQLAKTLFPVGELHKTEVRRIADEIGLPNARKKDSTGICFIGERPFREFLNRYIAHAPGPIKDPNGRVLGQHVGLSFYTLGQRQGLGIGGVKAKGAALKAAQSQGLRGVGEHQPWFVARKDVATNTLWVVQGHDHPWLLSEGLTAQDLSWTAGQPPALTESNGAGQARRRLSAKTRYRQTDAPCWLSAAPRPGSLTAAGDASAIHLAFDQAQWAVTPGQSAVLYDGDVCLGGGVIV